jgi:hypothetical protein
MGKECSMIKRSTFMATEHRMMVFENRMARRIFGSKGEEVAGGWRRLHNEELHNFLWRIRIILLHIRMKS